MQIVTRNSKRTWRYTLAVILSAVTWSQAVRADPIVRILDATQWAAAIGDGRVKGINLNPADPRFALNSAALNKVYSGQSTGFRNTSVSTNTSPVNGLVSSYGSPSDKGSPTIGGWCHIGPDPDYTNFVFGMNVFLPQVGSSAGFDTVAFSLVDDNDKVKAWTWGLPRLKTGLNGFQLALNAGAGAGGSTGFFEDAGFDITHVAMLQGSFRGTLTNSFPPIDGGATGLQGGTHSLAVAPEGDGLWLFAGGLIGVCVVGRRRLLRTGRPGAVS